MNLLFFVALAVASAQPQILSSNINGYQACALALDQLALFGMLEQPYQHFCAGEPALGLMATCLVRYHGESIKPFVQLCGITKKLLLTAYKNATDKYEVPENATLPVYLPVEVDSSTIRQVYEQVKRENITHNSHTIFGIVLLSYWFVVMLLAGIYHWSYRLFPRMFASMHGSVTNNIRLMILLPALTGGAHAQHLRIACLEGKLPTRFEAVVLGIWLSLAVIFCGVNNFPYVGYPMTRPIGDRLGVLGTFCLPVLILFAGRNNFLQWVTGWSYSRFITFHKWMARICTALILAHVIAKTHGFIIGGYYSMMMARPYMRWGAVGMACMMIMVFHSMLIMRKTRYELFLLMHIIFAAIFIAAGWLHTKNPEYHQFFIAATAIWVFDRVVRIIRLATFGVRHATIELVANETLHVTIDRPTWWKPKPGSHAFLHFLRPSCFWQSHPFTIVDSVTREHTITCYIKIKGGATHGLYQHVCNSPKQIVSLKVLVEGPYEVHMPLRAMESVVFFAGGNGIPGMYSEAMDLASRGKQVKLYWVLRHRMSLEWFEEELLKVKGTKMDVIVYITNSYRDTKDSISVSDLTFGFPHVEFRDGRPNIEHLVHAAVEDSIGPVGIASCAHPAMVDRVRAAVASEVKTATKRIELFEQIQMW